MEQPPTPPSPTVRPSSHDTSAPTLLPSALPDRPDSAPDPQPNDLSPNPSPANSSLLPPSNQAFTPLFTLLTNASSNTTHHPTTHYVFASDPPDHDPITTAALSILSPPSPPSPSISEPQRQNGRTRRDRYVLLDMDETGTRVLSAQSMSPDWAVVAADVGAAPTWEGRGGEEGGMMLRIDGVEAVECGEGDDAELGNVERVDDEGDEEVRRLEGLVRLYERQMGELRAVVLAGEGIEGMEGVGVEGVGVRREHGSEGF